MDLSVVVDRLDEELGTAEYAEVDASANGLQVGPSTGTVHHVAVAVDAAAEPIRRAVDAGADLLVTHHGLVWDGLECVTGRTYERVRALVDADVALYVSHLPLDGHQTLGNAAGLADELGLEDRAPFGDLGGCPVGQRGVVPDPVDPTAITDRLSGLETGGRPVRHLAFGPDAVESVAVVTGSGVDWLEAAAATGADALVTGEGKGHAYHAAREAGIHVYLAGHYATETFGVRALADRCGEWGLETTYVSVPTGL